VDARSIDGRNIPSVKTFAKVASGHHRTVNAQRLRRHLQRDGGTKRKAPHREAFCARCIRHAVHVFDVTCRRVFLWLLGLAALSVPARIESHHGEVLVERGHLLGPRDDPFHRHA
jgi:hypothetical protein